MKRKRFQLMIKNIFVLQTLTKVFISRILINFYNINHIKKISAKKSSEADIIML
jgi:hypothetical protein